MSTNTVTGSTTSASRIDMGRSKARRKAVIVGAGPVGCLAALSMAKMGWEVEVYEGRQGKSDAMNEAID